MKVYLDNCSFNRPFDDQSSMRIKLETEAKLFVQEKILIGKLQLIWSHILEYAESVHRKKECDNRMEKNSSREYWGC